MTFKPEAQTTVKEAKRCFEKLKVDLGEKIDMVSASRCNLLSRSLPLYQQVLLDYNDTVACEFHQLLINLRTHHHHQYTVCKILEEIRDLETEEMPFEESLVAEDDEFSSLALPEVKPFTPEDGDDDESLLDLSKNVGDVTSSSGRGQETGTTGPPLQREPTQLTNPTNNCIKNKPQEKCVGDEYRHVGDSFPFEKLCGQVKMNDIVLDGTVVELGSQKEELQPTATNSGLISPRKQETSEVTSSSKPPDKEAHTSIATEEGGVDIDDLLQLRDIREDFHDRSLPVTTTSTGQSDAEGQQDSLFNKWNDFSAFMSSTKDDVQNPLAGWEKEFTNTTAVLPPCDALPPSGLQDSTSSPSVNSAGSSTPAFAMPSASATSDALLSNYSGNSADTLTHDTVNKNLNLDEMLGFGSCNSIGEQNQVTSCTAGELLYEELRALDLSPPPAELFSGHKIESSLPAPLQPINSTIYPGMGQQSMMFRSPLGMTQGPPVFPTHGPMGIVNIPLKSGILPPTTELSMPGAIGGLQLPANKSAARVVGRDADKQDGKDKGKSWMNVFAHLDPLVNEKA